jgi:DNA segregation ATPase FtsK/SpoIIIE-like protein
MSVPYDGYSRLSHLLIMSVPDEGYSRLSNLMIMSIAYLMKVIPGFPIF